MVSAVLTGPGLHRAPYPLRKRVLQGATILALAVSVPAAFLWKANAVPQPAAAPLPTQAVASAGALTARFSHQPIQVRAVVFQTTYRVHAGDTLSRIAAKALGSSKLWPELWWANRHRLHNPDAVSAGVTLNLAVPPRRERFLDAAIAAIPPPPPPPPAQAPAQAPAAGAAANPPATAPAASGSVSTSGMGSFQACVISRESGGNPGAVNPGSGAGGLYQFLPSTWAALGYSGLPQDASVATQNAAFAKAYAEWGTSPWAPSDGC